MKSETENSYKERILRVLVHIQQHLDDALSLGELAEVACFSPYHFHRVFRGMVGESLAGHVRRLRLERAAHRLKFSDERVTRIAFDAGYETHEAFTRAFGTMFDQSPSKFRELHRAIPHVESPSGVHYRTDGTIDEFHAQSPTDSGPETQVTEVPPIQVVFIRHVGPYEQCGAAWGKLMAWAGPQGLLGPQMRCYGLCHDDPEVAPPEKVRCDVCLAVAGEIKSAGDVGLQTIGGGAYAMATHVGPYQLLGDCYAHICGQFLPGSGRELRSAPTLEMYRNNPQTTKPENLLTDVHVPLEWS